MKSEPNHSKPDRRLGRVEITKLVEDSLSNFVESCLKYDCEVLVLIQEEGLAIFLPRLATSRDVNREIIPSSALEHIEINKLDGKKVLLVDAAVRSGGELLSTAEQIKKRFRVKSISYAAFLILEGFPFLNDIVIPEYHVLTSNQYLWARDVLVKFLLNYVFVHFGDPPLWEFNFPRKQRTKLLNTLLDFDNSYIVPSLFEEGEWLRLSISNIELNDLTWVYPKIELQRPHKIRILIHKQKDIIRVLPVFFPIIPADFLIPISTIVDFARTAFPQNIKNIHFLSKSVSDSPYNAFRWISALGSLLLLRDFVLRVNHVENLLYDPVLSAPVPDLYQYSCSVTILDAFEKLAKDMTEKIKENNQYELPHPFFNFNISNGRDETSLVLKPPYENNSPEEGLTFALSIWLHDLTLKSNPEELEKDIDKGMPLETLYKLSSFMSPIAFDRALDRQIDEGVIKARLGRDDMQRVVRTYAPGSESIRTHLRSIGRAIDLISNKPLGDEA